MDLQGRVRRLTPASGTLLVTAAASVVAFAVGTVVLPDHDGRASLLDVVTYGLTYMLAAAVCLRAARETRRDRWAWRALAGALAVSVVGYLVYRLVVVTAPSVPFPSLSDALWLAYYVPLTTAVVGLLRTRAPGLRVHVWLDGLTGALAAAAVVVAAVLGPALSMADGGTLAVAVSLGYVLADVVLLALLVVVAMLLGGGGDRTMVLLFLGVVANLAGDIVFVNLASRSAYVQGGALDLTWLLGVLLMAAAAHTSRSAGPLRGEQAPATWRVVTLPFVAILVGVLVLAAGWWVPLHPAAAWCAGACVVTALVRTAVTFGDLRTLDAVREQARTDELTGLPNRRALLESGRQLMAAASARRPAALLLLDLDGFKEVNDGLGHHAGDELLRQVGPRLRAVLRSGDLLARLGGDEFAVLLPEVDLDEARDTAVRLHEQLLRPFDVDGVRLHIGVSIGVATAPVPAATVIELLRCADVAMYTAKAGREGVHVYVPDPRGGTGDRLRTMEELREALAGDQLEVHLQPQVRLPHGDVVGVEALVRWRHPTRGLLSPAELLPSPSRPASCGS